MPKPTVGDGAMTVSVADEAMRGTFESLYQSDAAKLGRPPSECVRVVVRAGTPGAPKGSKAEQQPPGAGSSEPAGTSEPAYCLTCVEALAVAAHLSTEAAIRCLWKAADLAGLTRDINPNTADRTWLLTELKVRCAALHSTARPRPQLEGFFQDPGKNTDPKAGTGTEPWDHKRTYARCKDDQFYYILVYDAAPWASRDAGEPDFSDDERKAYTQAVEDFRKRLDNQTYPKGHPKAGEKVYPGGGSYPGGGKVLNFQAKREVLETSLLGPDKIRVDWKTYRMEGLEEVSGDQALLEIKAGAHDPCMRALIFIGHGAAGAQKLGPYHLSVNGLLGSSEGRKTMFGDYDHRLDLYVSGTCKGAEEKEGEYEKQETTALTDNYVATNSSISVKELADMLGKVDLPVPKQP
jgi:hypothetical protein